MNNFEASGKKPSFWSASNHEKIQQSPMCILEAVQIKPIEKKALDRVFNYLIEKDKTKHDDHKRKIGPGDLMKVLNFLGLKPLKADINLIIWEVDDDLDGYIS